MGNSPAKAASRRTSAAMRSNRWVLPLPRGPITTVCALELAPVSCSVSMIDSNSPIRTQNEGDQLTVGEEARIVLFDIQAPWATANINLSLCNWSEKTLGAVCATNPRAALRQKRKSPS